MSGNDMTRERLFALHTELCGKGLEIMRAKNHDYTAGGSLFSNFRASERRGVPGEMGLLLRVDDKLSRIQTFIQQGTLLVKGEGVEDAIVDVINYMVLLAGMIEEKQEMVGVLGTKPESRQPMKFNGKPITGRIGNRRSTNMEDLADPYYAGLPRIPK